MKFGPDALAFGPFSYQVTLMNEMPAKLQARAQRKSAKREEKKSQIAESAIEALKELGYANTSLRDIAEKSDLSLGMLHYYFEDRTDLIIYCVEIYKRQFVADIMAALDKAQGREGVIDGFSKALSDSIADDAMTHRLWYDIRNQALFDATFRPIVGEIETMLVDIVRTAMIKAGHDAPQNVEIYYALLDGVFRHLMQAQVGDNPPDQATMSGVFRSMLNEFL